MLEGSQTDVYGLEKLQKILRFGKLSQCAWEGTEICCSTFARPRIRFPTALYLATVSSLFLKKSSKTFTFLNKKFNHKKKFK